MTGKPSLQSEQTNAGEQTLVSGVCPITLHDQLAVIANRPLQPRRNPNAQQKPCDTQPDRPARLSRPATITGQI